MGFLKEDKILDWNQMKKHINNYKKTGVFQFIELYRKFKNNLSDAYYWGYEMEYTLVIKDNENYKLLLKADSVIHHLQSDCWKPEYANWMVEKTPHVPFDNNLYHLVDLEQILSNDILEIQQHLNNNEYAIMIPNFPILGTPLNKYIPSLGAPNNYYSQSTNINDNVINPHIRFRTLTKNIRERRGKKVDIKIPVFRDKHTTENIIDMDCMAYGMGCSSQQITVQLTNINEARYLYDQFISLSPILMALSASCPIAKGYLSDEDTRWNIIEQAVDDRKDDELAPKSRYSNALTYISDNTEKYNNIPIECNWEYYKLMVNKGVPSTLAKHIAYLFIRDPIIMYESDVDGPENPHDFFLNINSSNWNNVRFKPPLDSNDSWKLEIRMFDIQTSSFKNAALMVFTILLTRAISYYQLYFYMPMTHVDKNFKESNQRDGINKKYYFRKNIQRGSIDVYDMMDINQIINGRDGLIQYIHRYLEETQQLEILSKIKIYLHYIIELASGLIPTEAKNIRDFVSNHPEYYQDSRVNQNISNDLIEKIIKDEL